MTKMALLEKKACPCPLDYPCHTFHFSIVATAAKELVAIAHVDCHVTVPAAVATAAVTAAVAAAVAADAVDCTAAGFVGHHVTFVVIIDSSIFVAVAMNLALTLFAVDSMVAKIWWCCKIKAWPPRWRLIAVSLFVSVHFSSHIFHCSFPHSHSTCYCC